MAVGDGSHGGHKPDMTKGEFDIISKGFPKNVELFVMVDGRPVRISEDCLWMKPETLYRKQNRLRKRRKKRA